MSIYYNNRPSKLVDAVCIMSYVCGELNVSKTAKEIYMTRELFFSSSNFTGAYMRMGTPNYSPSSLLCFGELYRYAHNYLPAQGFGYRGICHISFNTTPKSPRFVPSSLAWWAGTVDICVLLVKTSL